VLRSVCSFAIPAIAERNAAPVSATSSSLLYRSSPKRSPKVRFRRVSWPVHREYPCASRQAKRATTHALPRLTQDPSAARHHCGRHQPVENRRLDRRNTPGENTMFPLRRSPVPSGRVNSPPVSMLGLGQHAVPEQSQHFLSTMMVSSSGQRIRFHAPRNLA